MFRLLYRCYSTTIASVIKKISGRNISVTDSTCSLSLFPVAPTLEHRVSVKRFVSLQFSILRQSVGFFLTRDQPVANTNTKETQVNIHALSRIRTDDSSVQASEDSSCLRPFGHCDRHSTCYRNKTILVSANIVVAEKILTSLDGQTKTNQ
jgi:hypothetical protein